VAALGVTLRTFPWRKLRNDVWKTGEKIELGCGRKDEFIGGRDGGYK
jgi:hypothetical protein